MGADLILAILAIPSNISPAWHRGYNFIESLPEDDPAWAYVSPSLADDPDRKETATATLNFLRQHWTREINDRAVVICATNSTRLLLCGGTSTGDSPAPLYDDISDLDTLGVLTTVGFETVEYPRS